MTRLEHLSVAVVVSVSLWSTTASADFHQMQIQQVIGEYSAWREKVQGDGRLVGGEKLTDEGGRVLSIADDQVRVVDGPYTEAKEIVAGFFMIEAANYDEAVDVSRSCPHLVYGSRIELRQIDDIH